MENVDIAIIGAGVIGLAVASRVSKQGKSVVILEKHRRYGIETSSRNSEVVHAGIYYPKESLKSQLCHQGREKLYQLGFDNKFFIKKTGKLIVSTTDEETKKLEEILKNATQAGAKKLELLDQKETLSKIPELHAKASIWSPESGIIDSEELMAYYYNVAQDQGAIFLFNTAVKTIDRKEGGYELAFGESQEKLKTPIIINAAGLYSDQIAGLAGIDIKKAHYKLHWCKGSYFRSRQTMLLPYLVYPVPTAHSLGIHITPDKTGKIRLGPDVEFVKEINYAVDEKHKNKFYTAVKSYLPALKEDSLFADTSGIRPKLSAPNEGFRDFIITEESARGLPGLINLIGIESPGLTASPAIAEQVASMIE